MHTLMTTIFTIIALLATMGLPGYSNSDSAAPLLSGFGAKPAYAEEKLSGIGAAIRIVDDNAIVDSTFDNSPAKAAGLREGDRILSVDGKIVKGMSLTDVISLLRGKNGTKVKLKVQREDRTGQQTISIVRGNIGNFIFPKYPILRIETGMHTGTIRRIATNAAGRWLVTASEDKTMRIWELPNARLERIIRPPIGEGNVGEIFSVALSADSSIIACGESGTIYLFNRASGKLAGSIQLAGVPDIIAHLDFSPDGRFLAAALTTGGIRLYRTRDWSQIGEDKEYGGQSYSVHFSRDNRLVSTSWDGYLRLYDVGSNSLRLIAKEKTRGNRRPTAARFSPDGSKVAVGYDDLVLVTVHSGRDLSRLYAPESNGSGGLGSVAWSADGNTLYAGGSWAVWPMAFFSEPQQKHYIRSWSDGGRGSHHDTEAAENTIFDLAPMADGSLAYASGEPAFGLLDRSGERTLFFPPAIADYRKIKDGFRLSGDGTIVNFGYDVGYKTPASFNLATRNLSQGAASGLQPPITTAPGLEVTDWWDTDKPRLNGTPIKLHQYEISRALAIAPDGNSFILGTSSRLNRFNSQGKPIWEAQTYSETRAVNVAPDGSVVVAAYGDGTIRWYRMSDGKALAALFPHTDMKRWVLWTPEGYFDASSGGAELIGYHLNQGKDREARFISMKELYDVFYRPDIVQARFRGEDITPLITLTAEEALKNPPPLVTFTAPPKESAAKQAKVCYQVKSTGGGIGEVRLFQNGKLVKSDGFYREKTAKAGTKKIQLASNNSRAIYDDMRALVVRNKADAGVINSKPKGERFDECVNIESIPGENEIAVTAFNSTNTVQSSLESITFTSTRKPEEPHLYIVSIGADRYRNESVNLKYAGKDAKDFAENMSHEAASLYKPENIHVTLLNDAGKGRILSEIEKLASKVRHGDGFILFVASHGLLLQNQYYIVTSDFSGDMDARTMISTNEIVDISKRIKSLSQLYIFDTCHAGGVDAIISGLYDARMSVMARKMGLHIYASAGSVQAALDGYQGNGLYTHTLLQGMAHGKDVDKEKSGTVTVKKLGLYTKEMTTGISTKLGRPQTPFIINFGRDNPLFAVH